MHTFITSLLLPLTAFAYSAEYLPYSDAPQDLETAVAVSTLTEIGILQGNPDGTIGAENPLNRAEFVTIIMRLKPGLDPLLLKCFPDVDQTVWYAHSVCLAKELGIISGNAVEGLDPSLWQFEPNRSVQYEEALKILVELYDLPVVSALPGEPWYEPYVYLSDSLSLTIDRNPGDSITRGEMARIVANFYAYSYDELAELHAVQAGEEYIDNEVVVDTTCDDIVCDDGSNFPACTDDGQVINYLLDPCETQTTSNDVDDTEDTDDSSDTDTSADTPVDTSASETVEPASITYDSNTDISTDSEFLMLGVESHAMGAVDVFPDAEPLRVTKVLVTLTSDVTSINAFAVYGDQGRYLGRATKDSSEGPRVYSLSVRNQNIEIPHRETQTFYVRPDLKLFNAGGISGEQLKLSEIAIEGEGVWSNQDYSESESGVFSTFETTRSQITSVTNVSDSSGIFTEGPGLLLAAFRFEGERSDGTAGLSVTDIDFQIEENGGVTLSNVSLQTLNGSDTHDCTVAGTTITCSTIPESIGSFKSAPKTMTLYGDVDATDDVINASLRISINQNGSVGSSGDLTWSDGTSSFTWVGLDRPIVRGTHFSQ